MTVPQLAAAGAVVPLPGVPTSLEAILDALTKYGKPHVSLLDTGWHARISMNTTVRGAQFEVVSDYGHITPTAATAQCHQRVLDAVRANGGFNP